MLEVLPSLLSETTGDLMEFEKCIKSLELISLRLMYFITFSIVFICLFIFYFTNLKDKMKKKKHLFVDPFLSLSDNFRK